MAKFLSKMNGPHSVVVPETKDYDGAGNVVRYVKQSIVSFEPGVYFETSDKRVLAGLRNHPRFGRTFVEIPDIEEEVSEEEEVEEPKPPKAPKTTKPAKTAKTAKVTATVEEEDADDEETTEDEELSF